MSDEEKLDLIGYGVYMGSRWSKQNTISELEEIKEEISKITFITTAHSVNARGMAFTDSINKIIDEHISTLKGE